MSFALLCCNPPLPENVMSKNLIGTKVIKDGILWKRCRHSLIGTNSWNRRVFVLFDDRLVYYHPNCMSDDAKSADTDPSDSFPLKNLKISWDRMAQWPARTLKLSYAQSGMSSKKQRKEVVLLADDAYQAKEWMNILSRTMQSPRIRDDPHARFYNHNHLQLLVSSTNKSNDTPLHCLTRYKGAGTAAAVYEKSLRMATWLVEHGCDIGAINDEGKTAAMSADDLGNTVIASYLEHKRHGNTERFHITYSSILEMFCVNPRNKLTLTLTLTRNLYPKTYPEMMTGSVLILSQ